MINNSCYEKLSCMQQVEKKILISNKILTNYGNERFYPYLHFICIADPPIFQESGVLDGFSIWICVFWSLFSEKIWSLINFTSLVVFLVLDNLMQKMPTAFCESCPKNGLIYWALTIMSMAGRLKKNWALNLLSLSSLCIQLICEVREWVAARWQSLTSLEICEGRDWVIEFICCTKTCLTPIITPYISLGAARTCSIIGNVECTKQIDLTEPNPWPHEMMGHLSWCKFQKKNLQVCPMFKKLGRSLSKLSETEVCLKIVWT